MQSNDRGLVMLEHEAHKLIKIDDNWATLFSTVIDSLSSSDYNDC